MPYTDRRPRDVRVAADLRAEIMAGNLPPGTDLPRIQDLADRYGVATNTIQRALAMLKDEGFLVSKTGQGTKVQALQPLVIDASAYIGPDKGFTYDLLDVDTVAPPNPVREALKLSQGDHALLCHRLGRYRGSPAEVSWSYYPLDVAEAAGITERRKIRGGAPAALAAAGFPQTSTFGDRLSWRSPTTREAELLELPGDVPVLRQFRVIDSFTHPSGPVEVSVLVKAGHLYELEYRQRDH